MSRVSTKVAAANFKVPAKYRFSKILGNGSYGTVGSFRDVEASRNVAIKRIGQPFNDFMVLRRTLREVRLMRHFQSPYVLKIFDMISTGGDIYLVLELCDSDLDKVIHSTKMSLTEYQIRCFTMQMLLGILHMHSAHVIHRDLKPQNIFVLQSGQLKIGDFGLSRGISVDEDGEADHPSEEQLTEYVVTRWYRAPEVLLARSKYGPPVDVWSVGCIVHEMWTKLVLFKGKSSYDQLKKIFNVLGTPDPDDVVWVPSASRRLLEYCPPSLATSEQMLSAPGVKADGIDFVKQLLAFDPAKRISAEEATCHSYLNFKDIYDRSKVQNAKKVSPADCQYDQAYDKISRVQEKNATAQIARLIQSDLSAFRQEQPQLAQGIGNSFLLGSRSSGERAMSRQHSVPCIDAKETPRDVSGAVVHEPLSARGLGSRAAVDASHSEEKTPTAIPDLSAARSARRRGSGDAALEAQHCTAGSIAQTEPQLVGAGRFRRHSTGEGDTQADAMAAVAAAAEALTARATERRSRLETRRKSVDSELTNAALDGAGPFRAPLDEGGLFQAAREVDADQKQRLAADIKRPAAQNQEEQGARVAMAAAPFHQRTMADAVKAHYADSQEQSNVNEKMQQNEDFEAKQERTTNTSDWLSRARAVRRSLQSNSAIASQMTSRESRHALKKDDASLQEHGQAEETAAYWKRDPMLHKASSSSLATVRAAAANAAAAAANPEQSASKQPPSNQSKSSALPSRREVSKSLRSLEDALQALRDAHSKADTTTSTYTTNRTPPRQRCTVPEEQAQVPPRSSQTPPRITTAREEQLRPPSSRTPPRARPGNGKDQSSHECWAAGYGISSGKYNSSVTPPRSRANKVAQSNDHQDHVDSGEELTSTSIMQQMKQNAASARPHRFSACDVSDDGKFSKEAQLLKERWAGRHAAAYGSIKGSSNINTGSTLSRGRAVLEEKSMADGKRASSHIGSSRSTTPPTSSNSEPNTLASDEETPVVDEARLRAHIFGFGPKERIEIPRHVRCAPRMHSDVGGYWQELQASLEAMGAATQKMSSWNASPRNEISSQEPELEPSYHLWAASQA
eukprot:gnl/MRDRNA2_/MRDRNA2_106728_c0_seq1.p1 gnl/MRDRNA2_/MRDRNA2_106728_c0~~gnl/MRDRNA2_/MRDRNA2_106728_c0_seq1.p1  ORF type:complete len:1078 (-),score=215.52 gnl/MRDRNA2_/MRDRNA2_106728_c0_seq1:98-3331(-)